jgi:ABC-type lipoprotein export system ATPase subunit
MPYFIQGKAGSGKSTLMKYVLWHKRTTAKLARWS